MGSLQDPLPPTVWHFGETGEIPWRAELQPLGRVDETPITVDKRLIGHSYRSVGSKWLSNRGKRQWFHSLCLVAVVPGGTGSEVERSQVGKGRELQKRKTLIVLSPVTSELGSLFAV